MKRNGLGKLYDRLTPEERFRLDVEATARGDETESRKLMESCPRRAYTATDWGFSGRWQGAVELTLFMALDLCQHFSRLQMLDALREAFPILRNSFENEAAAAYMAGHVAGSRHAWSKAGMEGDPPGWERLESDNYDEDKSDPAIEKDLDKLPGRITEADLAPRLLEKLECRIAADALVVWEGYRTFCLEELQVEAGSLLKVAFAPAIEGLGKLAALNEALGLEPDEEKAREYRDVLSECWKRQRWEFERLSE